ncbi:O-antigen ligase family protein [Paenarthrobacter sp. NPDC090522]|uniref:O-antigen ligase family protein n=1 Tax=Paenarthrobacter sp. NPDC090522 TaxID=3364383 RepID=UPI00381B8C6E
MNIRDAGGPVIGALCVLSLLPITYLAVTAPWVAVVIVVGIAAALMIWQKPSALFGAYLVPLLIGEQALAVLIAQDQGNTVQKLSLILITVLACLMAGVRRPPATVLMVIALYGVLLGNALLTNLEPPQTLTGFLASTAGYLVPWLIFAVDWRKVSPDEPLRVVSLVPVIALALSLLLDAAGVIPLFTSGNFDMSRLGGTLPPAYLGAAGAFGAIASFWLWLHHKRGSLLTLIFGILVTAASATRAPVIVAFFVIVCLLLFTRRTRTRISGVVRAFVLLGLSFAGWQIAPVLIERTTGQDEYHGDGLSGRNLAWDYFWGRFQEKPWFGHGPGANAVLSQESSIALVREYFIAPHNTYLQLLVDFGLVGALALTVLIASTFIHVARKSARREKVLIASLGLSMTFYAFFDNVLAAPQIYVPMALILAAFNGMADKARSAEGMEPRREQLRVERVKLR